MHIRILGCSGGIGEARRTTSFMVDDDILIDAGTGAGELSLQEMAGLRHIFITHSHLDHVAGLPLLIDSVFSMMMQPLVIHARNETIQALKQHIFNGAIWPDFEFLPQIERPAMRYEVMNPGDVVELGMRRFESIAVNHVVPCQAYYVSGDSGTLAFSGDTTTNDGLWAVLNGKRSLDKLIVETAFPDADRHLSRLAKHYCPSLLAEDLVKLSHDADIYISHLKPGAEDVIKAELRSHITDRRLHFLAGGDILEI